MGRNSLSDIASDMRGIDIAMLSTVTEGRAISSRPMSNNGDVAYDGNSYYFTLEDTRLVEDIKRDPDVALAFTSHPGLFSGGAFHRRRGSGGIIRDKLAFPAHWTADLDAWFQQGINTPGLVVLKVHANHIKYWSGREDGELTV